MGVNGIESVIYGVEDLDLCVRYFVDFGLPLVAREDRHALFELEEGSSVVLRPLQDARVQGQKLVGYGVQQLIWGVPDAKNFERVLAKLRSVTEVSLDPDGTARFCDVDGIAVVSGKLTNVVRRREDLDFVKVEAQALQVWVREHGGWVQTAASP